MSGDGAGAVAADAGQAGDGTPPGQKRDRRRGGKLGRKRARGDRYSVEAAPLPCASALEMMARLIARLTIARFTALFATAFVTARFLTARLTAAFFTARLTAAFFTARLAAALLTAFRAILISFLSVAEGPGCNAHQPFLPSYMGSLESSTQSLIWQPHATQAIIDTRSSLVWTFRPP
jgi:hypothetical protein